MNSLPTGVGDSTWTRSVYVRIEYGRQHEYGRHYADIRASRESVVVYRISFKVLFVRENRRPFGAYLRYTSRADTVVGDHFRADFVKTRRNRGPFTRQWWWRVKRLIYGRGFERGAPNVIIVRVDVHADIDKYIRKTRAFECSRLGRGPGTVASGL